MVRQYKPIHERKRLGAGVLKQEVKKKIVKRAQELVKVHVKKPVQKKKAKAKPRAKKKAKPKLKPKPETKPEPEAAKPAAKGVQAYCMKCQTRVAIKNAVEVTTGGDKTMTRGQCAECGTSVYRIDS